MRGLFLRPLPARVLAAAVGLGALLLGPLDSQAADPQKPPASSGWTFQVSPYLWASGIQGTVGVSSRLPPAKVNISFDDVFNHIDWPAAVFFTADARSPDQRWGIFNDFEYIKLDADAATRGRLFGSATLTMTNLTDTLEVGYRFVDQRSLKMDVMGGVRIFSITNELGLTSGILMGRSDSANETWADPVIGGRFKLDVGGTNFFINGYADIGGMGLNSDLTWQFYGGGGYNFNNWLTGYFAYRYLNVQHEDGGFVYDIVQQGPLACIGIHF